MTDASGAYTFADLSNNRSYWVVVDSRTITPRASLNSPVVADDVWAEQTYVVANATPVGNPGGAIKAVTYNTGTSAYQLSAMTAAGTFFGGARGDRSDNGNTLNPTSLTGAEHIQYVRTGNVASAPVTGVNSAFSFNVVTNTRGGDATDDAAGQDRTVQGSLRQFIQNANAATGANAMRFVPAVTGGVNATPNAGGNTFWQISVTSPLPQITDANTTIDGTAFAATDGTTVRNTNASSMGAGGFVGTGADGVAGTGDEVPLGQVGRPELEIRNTAPTLTSIGIGLDVNAANVRIEDLSIWGFGSNVVGVTGQIVVRNVAGTVILNNVIGTGAQAFADPGPALRGAGAGVIIDSGDNGLVQNNLIGFNGFAGVHLTPIGGSAPSNWQILGNEIRGNGQLNNIFDGANLNGPGGNTVVAGQPDHRERLARRRRAEQLGHAPDRQQHHQRQQRHWRRRGAGWCHRSRRNRDHDDQPQRHQRQHRHRRARRRHRRCADHAELHLRQHRRSGARH